MRLFQEFCDLSFQKSPTSSTTTGKLLSFLDHLHSPSQIFCHAKYIVLVQNVKTSYLRHLFLLKSAGASHSQFFRPWTVSGAYSLVRKYESLLSTTLPTKRLGSHHDGMSQISSSAGLQSLSHSCLVPHRF